MFTPSRGNLVIALSAVALAPGQWAVAQGEDVPRLASVRVKLDDKTPITASGGDVTLHFEFKRHPRNKTDLDMGFLVKQDDYQLFVLDEDGGTVPGAITPLPSRARFEKRRLVPGTTTRKPATAALDKDAGERFLSVVIAGTEPVKDSLAATVAKDKLKAGKGYSVVVVVDDERSGSSDGHRSPNRLTIVGLLRFVAKE